MAAPMIPHSQPARFFPTEYVVTSRMGALRISTRPGEPRGVMLEPGTHLHVVSYRSGFNDHTGFIIDPSGKIEFADPLRLYDLEGHAAKTDARNAPSEGDNAPHRRSKTRRHKQRRSRKASRR
jgi:hypothetical protein